MKIKIPATILILSHISKYPNHNITKISRDLNLTYSHVVKIINDLIYKEILCFSHKENKRDKIYICNKDSDELIKLANKIEEEINQLKKRIKY